MQYPQEKWVCLRCGSSDVVLPASACWNVAFQHWEYELDECGTDWCGDCEDTCRSDLVPLTDLKDIALVAAHTPLFKSVRSNPDVSPI
jgi:hypothetical protein